MEFGQLMSNENQQAKLKTFSIENDIYSVLHKRSNIAAFSVEHQKFPERKDFSSGTWVASGKLK